MSIRTLILSTLLFSFNAAAIADANLAGSWIMKLDANGYAPRGARTLPKTLDIKQSGGKFHITAGDFGGEKLLYACSLTEKCIVGKDRRDWWVRWDDSELVLEIRTAGQPSMTLYRFYQSPDKQKLMLRAHDDPKAIAFPYDKQ